MRDIVGPDTIRSSRLAFVVMLCILCCGCSAQYPHRLDNLSPTFSGRGFGQILVVTRDVRDLVVGQGLQPNYVGKLKPAFGDAVEVRTASGKPIAHDFSAAICNGLTARGFTCLPLISGTGPIEEEVEYLLRSRSPTRVIVLTVNEFRTETYVSTSVVYDLSLEVWNAMGQRMAGVNLKGNDTLEKASYWNPARDASIVVPQHTEVLLSTLLQNDRVTQSLTMTRSVDALGTVRE